MNELMKEICDEIHDEIYDDYLVNMYIRRKNAFNFDIMNWLNYEFCCNDSLCSKESNNLDELFNENECLSEEEQEEETSKIIKKRKRNPSDYHYVTLHGKKTRSKVFYSSWFQLYVSEDINQTASFLKTFRKRFRIPCSTWLRLLEKMKGNNLFIRWVNSKDALGINSSPFELSLLGSLRYLGRGWTFDDIQEATGISAEVHRCFFHLFVKFGASTLYDEHVKYPTNQEEIASHERECNLGGMTGAFGSADAVNVALEQVAWKHRQMHLGFKQKLTARSFNVTVNHRRRMLHSARGFPARWNDKTIVKFDELVTRIRSGEILNDVNFTLFERDANGNIVEVIYTGAWLLVDNGYLQWSNTVPPHKITVSRKEKRFADWLESYRKDVECTFGILKQRLVEIDDVTHQC